jgi:hypothetical protein
MNDIGFMDIYIAFAVASVAIAYGFFYALSWLSDLEKKYRRLEQLDEHRVSKYDLQLAKDRFDKRISAIEDYLGVEIVEERARPARLVAKKIGDRS